MKEGVHADSEKDVGKEHSLERAVKRGGKRRATSPIAGRRRVTVARGGGPRLHGDHKKGNPSEGETSRSPRHKDTREGGLDTIGHLVALKGERGKTR